MAELEREKSDVDAFAAVAAHELMEPLVMIEVHAAMLASRAASASRRWKPPTGSGAPPRRLRRLVEAILHDARAGEEGIALRPVDLDRVLGDVLVLLRPEIEARSARIVTGPMPTVPATRRCSAACSRTCSPTRSSTDPAAHANIQVGAERDGAGWRLIIEDDGPPIPEAERGRIFEPFQRAQRRAALPRHRPRPRRSAGASSSATAAGSGSRPRRPGNCFYFTLPG